MTPRPRVARPLAGNHSCTGLFIIRRAWRAVEKVVMARHFVLPIATVLLATAGLAQDGLTIAAKTKPPQLTEEAHQLYLSACASVQQEFGRSHPPRPKVTLVLGADVDGVVREKGEVRLRKWDRYLFAQGVVILAFGELMPMEERLTMAERAVTWADATVNVKQLRK
jgi:hypothetical protein